MQHVRGVGVDAQTRCTQYHTPLDVIAIKMKCCRTYFTCKGCHDALADHPQEPWSRKDRAQAAVLCGVCGSELTIAQYLGSSEHCPVCGAPFNPRCREHHAYYFSGP